MTYSEHTLISKANNCLYFATGIVKAKQSLLANSVTVDWIGGTSKLICASFVRCMGRPLFFHLFYQLEHLLCLHGCFPGRGKQSFHLYTQTTNDPRHDTTNKLECAPRKDSDQLQHPPSLIRVFTVRLKGLSYLHSYSQTPIRMGGFPGLPDGSHMSFCWFVVSLLK